MSEQYINTCILDFSQNSTFRHGRNRREGRLRRAGEVQGNYRARKESLRRRILLRSDRRDARE